MASRAEIVVIGGGIIGLATATAVAREHPRAKVTVLEKEPAPALHQTGRNSGVIHSGVYYTPGSVKATTCRRGRELLIAFCRAHGIAHELCGKVIVAVEEAERAGLAEIARRGDANGVDASLVDTSRLRRLEPHVRGVEALHVRDAGIVDFAAVAHRLALRLAELGGDLRTAAEVVALHEDDRGVTLRLHGGEELRADSVVACAGLHSDRLAAAATGRAPDLRIVPFRGEYHALRPEAAHLCRTLIYPVPDPRFPFLGVHLTRHISGTVLAGPNAVLALAREGYRWRDVDLRDVGDIVRHPGLRRLVAVHWRTGLAEMWRSLSKRAFTRALQRLTPEIRSADLLPAPAGVRAQALARDGSLAEDFVLHGTPRVIVVLNAPSPAATASLAIAEVLATEVADRIGG